MSQGPHDATLASVNPEIRRLASRVVWWEPPEVVVMRDDFICRVMALGSWEDVNSLDRLFGTGRLRAALGDASPGIFDARSWHYWHHRLGLGPAGLLPTRACARVD